MCVGVLHPCRRVYGERTTDAGQLHSCLRWITAAFYKMNESTAEALERKRCQMAHWEVRPGATALDRVTIAADDEVGMAIDAAARFLTGTHFGGVAELPSRVSVADLVALADLILRRRDLAVACCQFPPDPTQSNFTRTWED